MVCIQLQTCNMKIVNHLDVTFNLNYSSYRSYQIHIIQYIYVESKHPPYITKPNPKAIEKHLTQLSCNKEILNESTFFYEDKLQRSGYQQKLKYNPVNTKMHNKCHYK